MSRTTKTAVAILSLLLVAVLAGAYYYFSGREYVLRFPEKDIQEKLSEKLPLTRTYLLVFQVTLEHPRVALHGESQRVAAGLDLVLNMHLGNEIKPLRGSIDVTGGVKYVPEQGELFLSDPVVERLSVPGIPHRYAARLDLVLSWALEEYFATHPIYSLQATDAKRAAARLVLKAVRAENGDLVVTLGI